jgi:Flp pilus assembly protein TadB
LRLTGIAVSIFCAIAVIGGLFLPTTSRDLAAVALVVCVLVLLLLMRFATKGAVKRTAEAYATALLRTCLTELLPSKK